MRLAVGCRLSRRKNGPGTTKAGPRRCQIAAARQAAANCRVRNLPQRFIGNRYSNTPIVTYLA